jgi:CRP/FNR family cyclic AMP-dependent transcriptional regulator
LTLRNETVDNCSAVLIRTVILVCIDMFADNLPEWLNDSSAGLRRALQARCDRVVFRPGEIIVRADEPTGGIFGIVSGRVDVHLPGLPEGHTLVHAFGPGWWLGDMSALSGRRRRFDHVARSPVQIARLSRAELTRLCQDYTAMWQCLARLSAANMRLTVDALEESRQPDLTERVMRCLQRLNAGAPGWGRRLPVSQGDLAAIAGLSRRRVNAALADLEAQAMVVRSYGCIELVGTTWGGE